MNTPRVGGRKGRNFICICICIWIWISETKTEAHCMQREEDGGKVRCHDL